MTGTTNSIVFIDTSLRNYDALVASVAPGAEIVLIDGAGDGVAQISQVLADRHGLSAVHILSHGADGELDLGATALTAATVEAHAAAIAGWSAALAPGADILLYGCDIAHDQAGQAFVQRIASLTGADVAASTDLTGTSALGGNWALEYATGAIQAAPLAVSDAAYADVLSHFRASSISWEHEAGRTIQFDIQQSWRASAFGSQGSQVGAIINVGSFNFGDNTSTPLYMKVVSYNQASDYFVGQAVTSTGAPLQHTYSTNGNYTAFFESGARLATSDSFNQANFRSETIVNVGSSNLPPVSSLAPIIQVADNTIATFQIPAVDPNGDTLSYSIGTAKQFISSSSSATQLVAPAGATVDSATGLVTWDIRDTVRPGVAPGQLYVMTVMVKDGQSETPLDFLLQVVNTAGNHAPTFDSVPPAQTAYTGQKLSIPVTAVDADGNLASIKVLNPPAGMTTEYHADEGELHIYFTPTLAQAGQNFVVTVQAIDTGGLTTNTSISFNVQESNTPPVVAVNTGSVVLEGGTDTITKAELNVTDAQQNPTQLTYTIVGAPAHGQLALSGTALGLGATFTQKQVNDGLVSFQHDGGETTSDQFTFTVADGQGGSTGNVDFHWTVTPVNDASVLATDASGPHAVAETALVTGDPTAHAVSGILAFTDPDLSDTHSVTVSAPALSLASGAAVPPGLAAALAAGFTTALTDTGTSGAGTIAFTQSVADAALDALDAGDTLTVVYQVSVADAAGIVSTQPVTIVLSGANDAPAVAGPLTASAAEGDAAFGRNLLAGASDADAHDSLSVANLSYAVDGVAVAGAPAGVTVVNGVLTVDPTDASFDALGAGQTRTVTVGYDVVDTHGAAVHQTETVTIRGVDDPTILTLAPGAATYVENAAAVAVNPGLTLTDVDGPNLTGAVVSIGTGFDAAQDRLSVTGKYGITGQYDAAKGTLTLSGSATVDQYQEVLRSVAYANTSDAPSVADRTVTVSVVSNGTLYNPENGHYYQYVSAPGIAWTDAQDAAHASTLNGLHGYLATITSASENAFVAAKLGGLGWIGASDDASQGTSEGNWIWADGPEKGQLFYQGQGNNGTGHPVNGQYNSWASGEPNNLGNENYGHFYTNGLWNDLPNVTGSIQGYVIEYGGMPNDPAVQVTGSTTIHVQAVNDAPVARDDAFSTIAGNNLTTFDFNDTTEDLQNFGGYSLTGLYSITYYGAGGTATVYNYSGTPVLSRVDGGNFDLASVNITTYYGYGTEVIIGYRDGAEVARVTPGLVPYYQNAGYNAITLGSEWTNLDKVAFQNPSDYVFFDNLRVTDPSAGVPITEDSPADLGVVRNDTDVDLPAGAKLSVKAFDATTTLGAHVSLNADGTLHYDPTGSTALQALAAGESATDTFTYTVVDDQGAVSNAATVTVTVAGANDAPTVAAPLVAAAVEAGPVLTADLLAGAADIDHGAVLSVANLTYAVDGGTASAAVPAGVTVTNGVLTLDPTDPAFDDLAAGQMRTLVVGYDVVDGNGGSVHQTETVTVTGTNDAPALVADPIARGLTESAGPDAIDRVAGTLAFTDVDLLDAHSVAQAAPTFLWSGGTLTGAQVAALAASGTLSLTLADSTGSGAGTIGYGYAIADQALDFLAQGETLTITYPVTVTDGGGFSSTVPVTVTVTGTNDAPLVIAGPGDSAGTATPLAETNSGLTAFGTLTVTDADITDTVTASVSGLVHQGPTGGLSDGQLLSYFSVTKGTIVDAAHTSGTLGWSFDSGKQAFDHLSAGEILELQYRITPDDGHTPTGSGDGVVTIRIQGTNDAPVVTVRDPAPVADGDTGTFTGQVVTIADHVTISDPDLADVQQPYAGGLAFVSAQGPAPDGGIARFFTIAPGAGTIRYDSGSFDYLAAGETVTVTFAFNSRSGPDVVPQTIKVTITGANDAPVVAVDTATHAVTEHADATGSLLPDTGAATLAFTDVDLSDTHQVRYGAPTATWSAGGTIPAETGAALASALTLTKTDSTGTGSGSVGAGFALAGKLLDFLAAGETLTVTYPVTVTDTAGASATQMVTFTVTGTNDAPVIGAGKVAGAVTELVSPAGSLTEGGSIAFGDVDLSDVHTVSAKAIGTTLGSLTATKTVDTTGTGAGGSIAWSYAVDAAKVEFLAEGQTKVESFTVLLDDGRGGVATQQVDVTIKGTNDAPVFAANTASHGMTEVAGITNGSGLLSSSASLAFRDVDLADTHTASVSLKQATWSGGSALPAGLSAALAAAATASLTDSTETGAGSVGVSFGLADKLADFLAAGETLTATYAVSVTDKAGAVSTQPVTFTITGTNDAPVLAADTANHGMTEVAGATNGTTSLVGSASLGFSDVDLSDAHTASVALGKAVWSGGSTLPAGLSAALAAAATATLTDSTGTGAGSVGVNFGLADKLADFLAAGETLTATYAVSVTDKAGAVSTQPVTFTITGTNDAPVLAADTARHGMTEAVGTTNGTGLAAASATLAFTDADLSDKHVAAYTAPSVTWSKAGGTVPQATLAALKAALTLTLTDSTGSGAGSVKADFALADKLADFLAAGETLTATYAVSVTDKAGMTSTQPVTFTLTGTNDAPVLAADTASHGMTEVAGITNGTTSLVSSASLGFSDVDLSDAHTASVALGKAVWSGGSALPAGLSTALAAAVTATLTDSSGTGTGSVGVSFGLADKLADFLGVGETLTATYAVSVTDKAGAVSTQPVTFTITGTNDAPVVDAARSLVTGSVTELTGRTGSTLLDTATGFIAFSDIDLTDRPTASVVGQSLAYVDASGAVQALSAAQAATIKTAFGLTADPAATNAGKVGWTFSLTDNAIDFLGAGERVTLVSTVQVDDHHGGIANQAVTVTLTGTDDVPNPLADIGGVQTLGRLSVGAAQGVLANDRDVDGHDTLSVTAIKSASDSAVLAPGKAVTIDGAYGDLTIRSDGSYTYEAGVWGLVAQKVPPGIVPVDTFTYTVSDGRGGTTTSTLNIVTVGAGQVYVQGTDGNDALSATPDTSVVGRLFGRDNAMVLNAGNGNDTLTGGKADDVLIAGTGIDKLTGGAGSDTFVFAQNFGKATVTDFKPLVDEVQFDHSTFANFADMKAHATQVGADVVIAADADHTLTLQNTLIKNLYASDFHFA